RRNGEHIELANLAAFLLSDMASYITGECIAIDGGKQFMSDAGSRTLERLNWTDEDWAAMRAQAMGKRGCASAGRPACRIDRERYKDRQSGVEGKGSGGR